MKKPSYWSRLQEHEGSSHEIILDVVCILIKFTTPVLSHLDCDPIKTLISCKMVQYVWQGPPRRLYIMSSKLSSGQIFKEEYIVQFFTHQDAKVVQRIAARYLISSSIDWDTVQQYFLHVENFGDHVKVTCHIFSEIKSSMPQIREKSLTP